MDMSFVYWVFTATILTLYSSLLVVLIRRKIRARFPIFFAFVAATLGLICVLNVAARIFSPRAYFFTYWILEALVLAVSFGVLREVFSDLLKPFNALIDLGKMLFWWAAVFLLFAAALTAFATEGSHPDQVNAAILVLQRSLQLMQCGFLLLLVVFEKRLGISWRSPGMCVALGLGTYAALSLLLCAFDGVFKTDASQDLAKYVFQLAVVMFWVVGLAVPAPARKNAMDSPKRLILQRWNEALSSYGYGDSGAATSSVESFLPGIEKTVDRVMARKAVS